VPILAASPLLAVLAVAVLLAGCGSTNTAYDAGTVVSCLRTKGLAVASDRANTFAPTGRDFVITFPTGNVLLAFAPGRDDAEAVESRVRSVAEANGALEDTSDVVQRKGNLVYWVNGPKFPPGLTKLVEGCL
jgi:hypothetical protein